VPKSLIKFDHQAKDYSFIPKTIAMEEPEHLSIHSFAEIELDILVSNLEVGDTKCSSN